MLLRHMPDISPANASFRAWFYARWGRENCIILGRSRYAEYEPFTQRLSIKVARGGGAVRTRVDQFDFWAGEWVVTADGKPAGRNRIEKILNGCALLESWTGVGGGSGNSLNFYDSARGLWHQTWISGTGFALALDGRFADGKMTLAGSGIDPETRAPVNHRITWTALPSGEVRQLWESSADGTTGQVLFDGLYTRER